MENRGLRSLAPYFGFFAAVLAYEWLLARRAPWVAALLALAMIWSWQRRGLGAAALGLRSRDFPHALRDWGPLWAFCAVLVLVIGNRLLLDPHMLLRGAVYFGWSAVQQLGYQSMVAMPLRGRPLAPFLAGAMFAALHVPNPVLIPATFVWGTVCVLLFERCPSVWGLALMQTMLSSVLYWLTPLSLSHGFRVGPFY